jgi:hypothetical protein
LANGQDPLLQWLSNAGSLGILAAGVLAFLRGWIVSGAAHQRVLAERDRAMDMVYKQADIAQRALEAAEQERRKNA